MKTIITLAIVGMLFVGSASAERFSDMLLPSGVEVGAQVTTYDGGEAAGFSLMGLYDMETRSLLVPRYLGLGLEQLSDLEANLKLTGRTEFLWQPLYRERFGLVIGGGISGENFALENTNWGAHYTAGVTVELGEQGKLMVAYRHNNLRVAQGTFGAGFVAALPF